MAGLLHLVLRHNPKIPFSHQPIIVLFTKSVHWCSQILSVDGIRQDPSNLETLLNMELPTTESQLQVFIFTINWLRASIPQFQTLVRPLHDFLEVLYTRTGKRTKRAVWPVSLNAMGCSDTLTTASRLTRLR